MKKKIQSWFRRRRYRVGRTVSGFIARDVRRDVEIIDTSRLDEGLIVVRIRTTNVLYEKNRLVPQTDFGPREEVALSDLWHWTGKSWGGLEDGRSIVGTHAISKSS